MPLPGAPAPRKPARWETLTDCRFIPSDYHDGDSFHVRCGRREFIFRLYFVDAPELDDSFPDRNREQARYFGVPAGQLQKSGVEAKRLIASLLQQPFTVTTRWQNAMGRSNLPRYYAALTVAGGDLGEILVSRGLARAKGARAILPGLKRAGDQMEKLQKLEAQARAKHKGIWAYTRPSTSAPPQTPAPESAGEPSAQPSP